MHIEFMYTFSEIISQILGIKLIKLIYIFQTYWGREINSPKKKTYFTQINPWNEKYYFYYQSHLYEKYFHLSCGSFHILCFASSTIFWRIIFISRQNYFNFNKFFYKWHHFSTEIYCLKYSQLYHFWKSSNPGFCRDPIILGIIPMLTCVNWIFMMSNKNEKNIWIIFNPQLRFPNSRNSTLKCT